MKRSTGVRMCATAAVGALSLALVTGCSSGSDKKTDDTKASGSASASAAAPAATAKALSKPELEKLLLTQAEVKGYRVDDGDDTLPKSKAEVKTDKPACDPLAWATAGLAPGDKDVSASNTIAAEPKGGKDIESALQVEMTFVGLSSYDGDGAEKAMKAVSDGVKACSGGYRLTTEAEQDGKVTKVTADQGSGQGDETVAFTESVDMDGQGTAQFRTEVVRKGNTVATFYTVNFADFGATKVAAIPAAVVQAQLAKIK
ncbi:hypothetical protein [Streptomyces griseosporeus]|uniref:hypothetical protein n=1 Tax=Streptomyces griseosporeus TaxID=1910 RepID=UPI0036FD867B